MEPITDPQLSAAVTGLVAMAIMWLARAMMAYVDNLPGYQKMIVVFLLSSGLPFLGKLIGLVIPAVGDLMQPGVANSLAAALVAMGVNSIRKQLIELFDKLR